MVVQGQDQRWVHPRRQRRPLVEIIRPLVHRVWTTTNMLRRQIPTAKAAGSAKGTTNLAYPAKAAISILIFKRMLPKRSTSWSARILWRRHWRLPYFSNTSRYSNKSNLDKPRMESHRKMHLLGQTAQITDSTPRRHCWTRHPYSNCRTVIKKQIYSRNCPLQVPWSYPQNWTLTARALSWCRGAR